MELDSTVDWLFWVVNSLEVINPTLVGTVMAFVPDGVSVMGVRVSVNIKASSSSVSDVSSVSREPSDNLEWILSFSVASDNSGVAIIHPVVLSPLDGDNKVFVVG